MVDSSRVSSHSNSNNISIYTHNKLISTKTNTNPASLMNRSLSSTLSSSSSPSTSSSDIGIVEQANNNNSQQQSEITENCQRNTFNTILKCTRTENINSFEKLFAKQTFIEQNKGSYSKNVIL